MSLCFACYTRFEMKVEIDQSGKIEDTGKDTVLAFSNKIWAAIVIPAKVKRQMQEIFRRRGQPMIFVFRTFAAGIILLLQNYQKQITDVQIDTEYPGHEAVIKDILVQMLREQDIPEPNIYFGRVGKKSMAHHRGYAVAIGKLEPERKVGLDDLVKIAIKKRPRSPKATEERLSLRSKRSGSPPARSSVILA